MAIRTQLFFLCRVYIQTPNPQTLQMKRIFLITLTTLLTLLSSPVSLSAQNGKIAFNRGYKLFANGKYVKAGMKFVTAASRDYFPQFEPLAYATLAFNLEGLNSNAKICIEDAEETAHMFASIYKCMFEGIPFTYDTVFDFHGEALYDALYTIADTTAVWKEYELKDGIDILLYAAASVYADESITDTAIYYANIGLKYNPDPDLYILKGDVWLEEGQLDSAMIAYTSAYDISPDDAYAHCGIGEVFHAREEFEIAMAHYSRALEIDPTDTWVLSCKASLLADMFELNDALELYNKLLELDPAFYLSYYNRAGVYFELDMYEEAIEDYTLYLIFEPDDEDAQYNLEAAEENLWEGY
jgi:tetratricopeptide (TPR) repeat protein